jgi:hypothetical protein
VLYQAVDSIGTTILNPFMSTERQESAARVHLSAVLVSANILSCCARYEKKCTSQQIEPNHRRNIRRLDALTRNLNDIEFSRVQDFTNFIRRNDSIPRPFAATQCAAGQNVIRRVYGALNNTCDYYRNASRRKLFRCNADVSHCEMNCVQRDARNDSRNMQTIDNSRASV